jgi:hypothetical protein
MMPECYPSFAERLSQLVRPGHCRRSGATGSDGASGGRKPTRRAPATTELLFP